jgi:hypothetical protein
LRRFFCPFPFLDFITPVELTFRDSPTTIKILFG